MSSDPNEIAKYITEDPDVPSNRIRAYHVSESDFSEFDPSFINDIGFHFAEGLNQCLAVACERDYTEVVIYTVDLLVNKPIEANDALYWDENEIETNDPRVNRILEGNPEPRIVRKVFKRYGYDCVRYSNEYEGPGIAYIVWDVNKIKIIKKQRARISDTDAEPVFEFLD